ncbi:hypothetical protein IIDPJIOB_02211 [Aeromonas veronii]
MVRVAHINKAGVLVSPHKGPDLRQGCSVLLIAKVTTLRQPRLEADPHRSQRLPIGPACDPQPGCQLTGSRHQREPVDGAAYLIARLLRRQFGGKALYLAPQSLSVRIQIPGQCLGIGSKRAAVLAIAVGFERVGEGAPALHTMKPLKRPMVACIARDLDCAYLHPRLGTLARAGGVIFKAQFASGEEQQAPCLTLPQLPILLASSLALAICQHVGGLPCFSPIHLAQFVKAEQSIIAPAGYPLNGVAGCPPCLAVAIWVAVDAGGGLHDGGLAIRALTFEVKASPFHADQREKGGCKGQGQGKAEAGVTHRQRRNPLLPLAQGAALDKVAGCVASCLQDHPIGVRPY